MRLPAQLAGECETADDDYDDDYDDDGGPSDEDDGSIVMGCDSGSDNKRKRGRTA